MKVISTRNNYMQSCRSCVLLMLFIGAIVLTACGNKTGKAVSSADSVIASDESYVPQRSDYTFRSEVRTITEDDEVRWDTIVVYLTDARGNTQQLYSQALPLDTLNWKSASIGEITEEDWNFDDIPDLQVGMGPMNGFGNFVYDVWLWDDQTHKFKHLENSDVLFSPEVYSAEKCIVSIWRLDDEVEIVKYKWKDGKLVESEREQLSYSELASDSENDE